MNDALAGLVVLDFSQVGAGPTCGMLLGDLGADVIKVEAPGGDIGRKLGPPWQNGESVVSMSFNRNKRSIAIDLKHPAGPKLARRLAAAADVVLESFRPGVMDRLGIGYAALREIHPRLVFCSVSAYGQTGPWRDKPGVDGIVQAVSGLMSNIGEEDSPPMKVQVPAADMTTGFLAFGAVLAALRVRDLTGQGQHLDVSLYNSALMLQQSALASYLASGEKPVRSGSAAPYSAPNEAYPTRDGWIMIAAYHEDRWKALCEVLGDPPLATDPRFATNPQRVANRKALTAELSTRLAAHGTLEWQERFETADIICAPIAGYDMVMDSPQLAHNGVLVETRNVDAGVVRMPGAAFGDRDAQSRVRRGPPAIGEHSREILGQFGVAAGDIDALLATGVVQQRKDKQ
ncbi:CoA transferase [Ramlibacter alkalitolerans]|uniref:CoA transferase n=1 Tax=Ramlibacter alkalitolerans TaxID=2039631 RepID=A0ABS1JQC9_9BURK|nr:CoA transferase [Ramlibacter alkalitolerans]